MNIPWYLVVTAIVMLIQAKIYKRFCFVRLRYNRVFSTDAVFEGQQLEMIEQISNRKLLPLPWIRVESKIDPHLEFFKQSNLDIKYDEFHKSLFSLMPYTGITRRHKVKCTKRGFYNLKTVAITCGDLFGVQDNSATYEVYANILVYPKLIPLEEISLPNHSWQGDVTVRRWILDDPFLVSGVREYCYGDSFNQINWKATARVGKLQVNNRDFTAQPKLLIYLNIDITEDMWEAVTDTERIEKGISYSASIANYAISQGIETGFGSNGYIKGNEHEPIRIPPRCSRQQLTLLFETMAKLVIERSTTFYTFLEQDINSAVSGNDILIITSFVSRRMQSQIDKLKSYGNSVEILWLYPDDKKREDNYAI